VLPLRLKLKSTKGSPLTLPPGPSKPASTLTLQMLFIILAALNKIFSQLMQRAVGRGEDRLSRVECRGQVGLTAESTLSSE